MMMQGFAAASRPRDPGARAAQVRRDRQRGRPRLSGAPPDEVFRFFAHGMLLNIITALDLPAIAADNPVIAAWAAEPMH